MRWRFWLATSVTFLAPASLQACTDDQRTDAAAGSPDATAAEGNTRGAVNDGGPVANTNGDGGSGGDADKEPTGPPAVRYIGRFDTRDPGGTRIGWAGVRVVVRFNGTGVTATITENDVYRGPSRYDVIIDGKIEATPFAPDDGTKDYVLASGLAAGTHVLELWRRTEGSVAITQFKTFAITGGQLLAPPTPKTRRIEFVGDSASNGYGVECASASESFSGATQNEHKSYTALVANALSAEHSNISFSGKGLSRNFDSDDDDLMGAIYPRILPNDTTSTWAFTSWLPDVVLVALGTNDFADTDGRPGPDLDAFKAKNHELVTLIRAKNPNAQIVCAVSATLSDDYPAGFDAYTNVKNILEAIVAERKAAPFNDAKVHFYEMPRADTSQPGNAPDLTGCDGHPSASLHQKVAPDLTAKLKTLMNW